MSKPLVHAECSVKRWGGKAEDYLPIHILLDSSKSAFPDLRHRALTHNSWFITEILPRIFGEIITNSDDKKVSVRDIGEHHVLEDFHGLFIPAVSDFLSRIEFADWMDNARDGDTPPSHTRLEEWWKTVETKTPTDVRPPTSPPSPLPAPILDPSTPEIPLVPLEDILPPGDVPLIPEFDDTISRGCHGEGSLD